MGKSRRNKALNIKILLVVLAFVPVGIVVFFWDFIGSEIGFGLMAYAVMMLLVSVSYEGENKKAIQK